MARIRSIKPDFFMHDGLAELSPLHRLLFIGLWTQADREGRLEDRPARIKVAVLPYDKVDVDQMLEDLARHGFVVRYEVDGASLIQVTKFAEHQLPHHKEPPSMLPAMDGSVKSATPYPNERTRAAIYERDGYRCAYCDFDMRDIPRARCLDHVIPLAAGGTNDPDNVVTACKRCNGRKGGRTPTEAGMPWPKGVNPLPDPPVNGVGTSLRQPPDIGGEGSRKGREQEGSRRGEEGADAPASADPVADYSPELAEAVAVCHGHEYLARMLDPALVLARLRAAHPELDLLRTVRLAAARLTPERVLEQERRRKGPDGFLAHFFANADTDRITGANRPAAGGDDIHARVAQRCENDARIQAEALERERLEDEAARRAAGGEP